MFPTSGLGAQIRNVLLLALAAALVPELSNVTLGRLQLHFMSRDCDDIDVWEIFSDHITLILSDLETIGRREGKCAVTQDDPCSSSGFTLPEPVDCVVTSPPTPTDTATFGTRDLTYTF